MYKFDGIAEIIWLGMAAFVFLFVASPPGILWGVWWLLGPRLGARDPVFVDFAWMFGAWLIPALIIVYQPFRRR